MSQPVSQPRTGPGEQMQQATGYAESIGEQGGQIGQQHGQQQGGQLPQMSGQQRGGSGEQGMGGPVAKQFEESLTGEMRLALHDFVQAANVCEWCADRCVTEGSQMATCIRLCRDVADLALQNVRFMARDSPFGPELAETFALAAEECANECAQHQHDHCQECASVLRRAVDSTWSMLESFERQQAGGSQPIQEPQQGIQQY